MSLFDRIDSIADPARPRLSRREKMAALFGCGGSLGFVTLMATGRMGLDALASLVVISVAFALVLMAAYGLLFIVPTEVQDHETRT